MKVTKYSDTNAALKIINQNNSEQKIFRISLVDQQRKITISSSPMWYLHMYCFVAQQPQAEIFRSRQRKQQQSPRI